MPTGAPRQDVGGVEHRRGGEAAEDRDNGRREGPSNRYRAARKARRETKTAKAETTATMPPADLPPPVGHVSTGSGIMVDPVWGSMRGPPATGERIDRGCLSEERSAPGAGREG